MLPSATPEQIKELSQSCIDHTNAISGGLIMKAARRTNSTGELLGIVLTKFLISTEVGQNSPICWCSLDDFSKWLGKPSGDRLADLLIFVPSFNEAGVPHLDVIVSEAKYVKGAGVAEDRKTSAKQLRDTLQQIARALSAENPPLDQGLWLARISDMILSRLTNTGGQDRFAPESWRKIVRNRECSFSVWGYSHVFVYDGDSSTATSGVEIPDCKNVIAQQETFNAQETMELFSYFKDGKSEEVTKLRLRKGHTGLGKAPLVFLKPEEVELPDNDSGQSNDNDGGAEPVPPTEPGTPSAGGGNAVSETEDTKKSLNGGNSDTNDISPALPQSETHDGPVKDSPLDGTPLEILEARSKTFSGESIKDDEWLKTAVDALKMALRDKGMSSKLVESRPPVLTPNAAIISFKGGPDLTVKKVEKESSEFLTTYGIEILRIIPGPGMISIMVTRPTRKILHTSRVLTEFLQSSAYEEDSEAVLIGVREEDGLPQLLNPFDDPHTLVSGKTGSGKSVLLQTMLLYIGVTRSPSQTHVYLVDGKGTDFVKLRDLPHLKNGSGHIITKKEESVAILESLENEMEMRYEQFAESGAADIRSYRKTTGIQMPTIFYIQDEFASWMQDSEYAESITQHVNNLSIKSRAAGIFLIFGLQRPDNTVMPMQLRSNLGNRLTLQVADRGTAEIATGDKNSGAERLLGKGHMLAKLEGNVIPIQVPLTDIALDLEPLVRSLVKQYSE